MGSQIQFYSDSNCYSEYNTPVTGPNNGECTQFSSSWQSFRIISLEQTCAVTVYANDVAYCSSSTLWVANFGECYNNHTVNQFSVDCQDTSFASTASAQTFTSVATSASSQSSSTSTLSTVTTSGGATVTVVSTAVGAQGTSYYVSGDGNSGASNANSGLSTGAQAGIGVGVALAVILLLAGAFLMWRRRNRSKSPPAPNYAADNKEEITKGPPGYYEIKDIHNPVQTGPSELSIGGSERAELPSSTGNIVYEAPGDEQWPRQELQGSTIDTSSSVVR